MPSEFILVGPSGGFSGSITTSSLASNTPLRVFTAQLEPGTLNLTTNGLLRFGLDVSIPVTSSDPNVGTITVSPVVLNTFGIAATEFDPANVGVTTLTAQTPAGRLS